jgi:ABC-2 type transport system permease protein
LLLVYIAFQEKGVVFLRKIWTVSSLHLKEFFTSPGSIALMFVLPILFGWIFGGMSVGSEVNKPIVNVVEYKGEFSGEIVNLLKKNDHFEWKSETEQQAKLNVSAQEVVAAVVIPENIEQRISEKKPLLDIIVQTKTEDYLALFPHLQGTAGLISRSYQVVENQDSDAFPKLLTTLTLNEGVAIDKQIIQKDDTSMVEVNLMFVGFAIMFMMFGLSDAASSILNERIGGTWGRLMVVPASKLQISFGYLFSYFLMGWIQFAVLMVVMNLMFDTNWGNLMYMIPFASLVIVCVVGFGLMIAGLVKTKQQAMAISTVLIVVTCMLGGVYWPLDFVPEVMQKMALAVPQSWAMTGFKEIISGSLHFNTLLNASLVLVGFTFAFLFIGLRGITYK